MPLDTRNDIRSMDADGVPRAEIARRLGVSHVIPHHRQYLVGNEVPAGAIGLHDGLYSAVAYFYARHKTIRIELVYY